MVRPILRSALLTLGVAVGALVSGVGGAPHADAASTGKAARAASSPATLVSRPVCTSSLDDPQGRAATFNIRTSRGQDATTSYGFTAVLEEKPAGGAWGPLTGTASPPGLGAFQPAAAGAAAMVRRINVRGLRMGSAYRLKVTFRWVTPTGKQRVTRRSSACTVKELRPNLGVVGALPWTPGTRGDQVVYRVQLRVQRPATLLDRAITISVNQGTTLLGRVSPAPIYHGALVLIPGALCTPGQGVTYRVEVAPAAVEESTMTDNELAAPCSSGQATSR